MKTYEITTLETMPVIRKYVYTLEATSIEDAERMFRDGNFLNVSFIKEMDEAYQVTNTKIKEIAEVN
jgi:hypothetical protein